MRQFSEMRNHLMSKFTENFWEASIYKDSVWQQIWQKSILVLKYLKLYTWMKTFLHSVAFENIAKNKEIWKKMELCWNSQLVALSTETRITWIQSLLGMSPWVLGNDETDVDLVQYFKSVSWFTRTRRKMYCPGQALAEKLWFLFCFFFSH